MCRYGKQQKHGSKKVMEKIRNVFILLMIVIAITFCVIACVKEQPKPQALTTMSMARVEAAAASQTWTINPGDRFAVGITVTTNATFHSIGFNVTWPACLQPSIGEFTPGYLFT